MNKSIFKIFISLFCFCLCAFSSGNGSAFLLSGRKDVSIKTQNGLEKLQRNVLFNPNNSTITTGQKAFACIILSNFVSIIMQENTQIVIDEFKQDDFFGALNINSDEPSKSSLKIKLIKGGIFIDKQKSNNESSFIISTENLGIVEILKAKQNIAFFANQEEKSFKIYGFKQNGKGANLQYFTAENKPTRNIITEHQNLEIRWLVTEQTFTQTEPVVEQTSSKEFRDLEEFSSFGKYAKEKVFFQNKDNFKITTARAWLKQRPSNSHLIK